MRTTIKIRTYKDGRVLVGQRNKSGLDGYGLESSDYNRWMLYPDGRAKQHVFSGRVLPTGWTIEFSGRDYRIVGEY